MKVSELLSESPAFEKDLDENKPIVAKGVKGVKSTPFSKRFKNFAEYEKWLDKNEGDVDIYQVMNEEVGSPASSTFQVRIQSSDWQDISLGNDITLEDIADAVEAPPTQTTKFDISKLTEIVERWIGDGPDGYGPHGGTWDEMHFDVASLKYDVLKISYMFSGFDKHHDERRKIGIITIMPA